VPPPGSMPDDPFFTEHASASNGPQQPLMADPLDPPPPFQDPSPPFRLLTPKQIYQVGG
jgi:hypothetical protein